MPKLQAKSNMPSFKEAINRMFQDSPELIAQIKKRYYRTNRVLYGDFIKLKQKREKDYQGSSVILPAQPPERTSSMVKSINKLDLND
jgi:hypothetical protein